MRAAAEEPSVPDDLVAAVGDDAARFAVLARHDLGRRPARPARPGEPGVPRAVRARAARRAGPQRRRPGHRAVGAATRACCRTGGRSSWSGASPSSRRSCAAGCEPHRLARYLEELADAVPSSSTTPAGSCRRATRRSRTCTGARLAMCAPPARCWPTGSACSESARRSGSVRPRDAHPAGPLHAGVLPPAATAGARPATAADLDALRPAGLAAPRPPRCRRGGDAGRRGRPRPRRGATARRCSSSTRPTSAAVPRISPPRSARRRVHYAAKAFLCTEVARWVAEEGLALDVCSGGELAVALRAGFPRASGSPCTATTSRSTSCRRRSRPASATSCSTPSTRSPGWTPWPRAARADARAGDDPADRRRRGAHPRVHRHRARGPEVRLLDLAAHGDAAEAVRRVLKASRRCRWSGCTATSARRSSTPPASRWPRTGWSGCSGCCTATRPGGADVGATLDLGGGFGIAYRTEDDPATPPTAGRGAARDRDAASARRPGWPSRALAVEPGRAIAGPGTVTLYEVGTIKDVPLAGRARRGATSRSTAG